VKVTALDLNLLVVLDVVLEEGSVSRAASRLNMSVPAVSRALGRLRAALGDPLMVRSGRGLQPTATALDLKPRVRALVVQAHALLDAGTAAPHALNRTFTVLAPAEAIASAGALLLDRVAAEAPGVKLRFLPAGPAADEAEAVRDGTADLAISVNAGKHADLHAKGLVREPMTAVVRAGHDLATGRVTPSSFSAWPHLLTSRRGRLASSLDSALAELGHPRTVACCVPDFLTGLHLAGTTDLVAIAPARLVARFATRLSLTQIEAPVPLRQLRVSQLWHPRHHDDPAHQWLRRHVAGTAAIPHDLAEDSDLDT
jgi:DNA-binding transcriptional LysR family regulator